MSDINPTKLRLANALKELMEKMPFEKISVTLICDRCGLNRKSFYYHFEDKYDLLNWIYDTEIFSLMEDLTTELRRNRRLEIFSAIYSHFRKDKRFYQKVLCIEGRNSFSELLWSCTRSVVEISVSQQGVPDADDPFILDMITDIAVSMVERSILDEQDLTLEQFRAKLRTVVRLVPMLNITEEILS